MPDAVGFAPSREMPAEWVNTGVVRYVDDPYSIEALPEQNKTCVDLGPLDVEGCFGAPAPGHRDLKDYGEAVKNVDGEPPELVRAHQRFANAGRLILGEERFMDSKIEFTYRRDIVAPSSRQIGIRMHVDSSGEHELPHELRLVGMACNVLPTILYNGGLRPNSLRKNGGLVSLNGLSRRFRTELLPLSRLILTPPAMLHDIPRLPADAPEPVDRLFMRWHLLV